ncbi:hypothetical protein Tco_1339615, partial [Tanacetum coccineum]
EGLSLTQSVGPLGYECIYENESVASSMLLPETKSLNYHSISMPLTDGCFDKWGTSQNDDSVLSIGSAIPLSIPFDTTFFSDAAQENASMRLD